MLQVPNDHSLLHDAPMARPGETRRCNEAYPVDTSTELRALFDLYATTSNSIEVSFRKMVPWLKVGERATHYLHPYPAKLLPHIAHFFLASEALCSNNGTVLDPFGGTGTVALETVLSGRIAAYIDTNPLARAIAKTKVTPLDIEKIQPKIEALHTRFLRSRSKKPPSVINIRKWYSDSIISQLSRLKAAIEGELDGDYRHFFLISFSATARKVSIADPRLSVPVQQEFSPKELKEKEKVWARFSEQLSSNISRARNFKNLLSSPPHVIDAGVDARLILKELGGHLDENSVELIITSPPYAGAQKYIRASSLSLGWLGFAGDGELKPLENKTIGREHLLKSVVDSGIETSVMEANEVISRIRKINPSRAAICAVYLNEMEASIIQMAKVLKAGGYAVIVIGNNHVCGEAFLSSEYVSSIFNSLGFRTKLKLIDEIKSRGLMTKRNKTASMITREWVLVFQKPLN